MQAQGTGRDRALGVLHARAQGVATTQVDGVDAQPASDLVDHHLGRGHGLQGTVAAHRAGLHAARMIGGDRQVVLRHVVDRLRGGGAHRRHRGAVVGAPAAVGAHVGAEDAEAEVVPVYRQLVADVERVALDAALELLVAVVGQAHRHTLAIQRGERGIEDEDVVVLGAVADGIARMDVELLQGEARRLDHVHAFVGDFERALGGDHEVQGLARRVVPAVAVVRLQCRRLDRWGLVALVEDQPVLRRVFQLLGHALGMEQPLLGEVAVQLRLAGPYRFAVEDGGEQHRVLQAGELVVLVGRLAADPDEAIAAVGIALVQRGLGAIADRLVVELELELGPAEALEVVPDQDRHRMADEHRHLARRQERIGRMRLGEDDTVLLQVGGGDDTVRLQLGAQPGKVVAFVDAVGANGLQQHGVALLLRPAGHVPGADIAGEHLVAADLGQGVVTETDLTVARHPALGGNGHLVLEQGSERLAAERRQGDTHAGDQPALEKGAPGYITVGHASSSGWYGSHPCRYSGLNSSSGRTRWSTQAEKPDSGVNFSDKSHPRKSPVYRWKAPWTLDFGRLPGRLQPFRAFL